MSGDSGPLLVPVPVSVALVDSHPGVWFRPSMKYEQLSGYGTPTPGPFDGDVDGWPEQSDQGAYVSWTLPAALRRGRRQEGGPIEFPRIPNRWLVVRLLRPGLESTAAPAATAWVVQSDALGEKSGVPYLHPADGTPTTVGHRVDLSSWSEPSSAPPPFLTAVAEANPSFAAFQPFHQNVLSMHDDLADVAKGLLTYFVLGWYSDPSADPLASWQAGVAGKDFADALAELGWSAEAAAGTTRQSLYHGIAAAVPWGIPAPGGVSAADAGAAASSRVAIGGSGIDGMAAFVEAAVPAAGVDGVGPAEAGRLIEALHYDLIEDLGATGAEDMVAQESRDHWFGSVPGGTEWTVADVSPGSGPPPDAKELASEATLLARLNEEQTTYDTASRSLVAARRRLVELWWKRGVAETIEDDPAQELPWGITGSAEFKKPIADCAAEIKTLIAAAKGCDLPAAVGTQTLDEAVRAYGEKAGLSSKRRLKAIPESPFWHPADPVMVLSGSEHAMRLDPTGSLACRWPAELVSALEVEAGGGAAAFTVSASQVPPPAPAPLSSSLPPQAPALLTEALLLDPAGAAASAAAAGHPLGDAELTAAATSIAAAKVPAGAGVAPACPAPFPWQQPWQPLFLAWSVKWWTVPFAGADGKALWAFDGLDYEPTETAPAVEPVTLSGSSILTPNPTFQLRARIDQFIADNPKSPAAEQLEAVEGTVADWDLLSQAFSGLTTQLAQWSPVAIGNPTGQVDEVGMNLSELLQGAVEHPPLSVDSSEPAHGDDKTAFGGMRAGLMRFDRLVVIDAFGQSRELVDAENENEFEPLPGCGFEASATQVKLAPRLLQPARLNLDPDPAQPILGWLIPNHVDEGIAVYGADGTPYGEMAIGSDAAGEAVVQWTGAPLSGYPEPAELTAEHEGLGKLVTQLIAAGAETFQTVVQAIDETMWTVDPLGARRDAFLSVLAGRPLAVVAAELSLELQADAWENLSWPLTFAQAKRAPEFLAEGYRFDVRLGDLGYREDGLIGYFVDGAYDLLHALHVPAGKTSKYLEPVVPGAYVQASFSPSGRGPGRKLTMIVDPRARVHARTGLLPVQTMQLPPALVDPALAAMSLTFRVGPTLTTPPLGDAAGVRLPLPAERHGSWTWLELRGKDWSSTTPQATDAAALPATPPTLRDGLLRLSGALGPDPAVNPPSPKEEP